MADVMFVTQRPLAVAALNENATAAGWKSKPSWFLVSEHDNAISPDAERFMAQRMGATTDTIDGLHRVHREARRRGHVHPAGAAVTS